ncbi:MAG: hypothetical protein D3906_07325 [Candidatus Electrothrix sp. AUS1_2]|nr:hypothetical protein [Candidatus Electrothrix sp. AUS1_2]
MSAAKGSYRIGFLKGLTMDSFSAPDKFGGYDKLSKIYELNFETTKQAVDVTLGLVGIIHRFVGGERQLPHWIPERTDDGFFLID